MNIGRAWKLPVCLCILASFFVSLWMAGGSLFYRKLTDRNAELKKFANRNMTGQRTKKQIIFIRTSQQRLEWFELCALHTAAKHNPNTKIKLLTPRKFQLPKFLVNQGNVQQEILNFPDIFKKTPLAQWYRAGSWKVRDFVKRVRFLSDALRLAYLYKYGGIYMDTDLLTLKSLETLKTGLAFQGNISSGMWLANGFMVFNTPNHPFLRIALNLHVKNFNAKKREFKFGPELVTKTFKKYQKIRRNGDNSILLPDIRAYPQEMVYPVAVSEFKNLLRAKGTKPKIERRISTAVTLHLWRNQIRKVLGNSNLAPPSNSLLYFVAERECPAALNYVIRGRV